MIDVLREGASPRVAGLVQSYESRQAKLGDMELRVPLAARTDLVLDFYLQPSTTIEDRGTGQRQRPPSAVVVAPQTRHRMDVIISGEVDMFSVRLQPTALHEMFGLPMAELTNGSLAMADLFGAASTSDVFDQLGEQSTLSQRAQVIEDFLQRSGGRKPKSGGLRDPIAGVASALQRTAGGARMDDLAAEAGLSTRHLSRLFSERVGMSPKVYARVVRLQAAVAAKAAAQNDTWAEIAQAVGYFDQSHLNHDFRELTGATPTDYLRSIGIVARDEALAKA